jgi:transcription factor IIIB subunit 2
VEENKKGEVKAKAESDLALTTKDEPMEELKEAPKPNDDQSLSDIDDCEVEQYLLTDKEVKLKTAIWESMNQEWLAEQAKKQQAPPDQKVVKHRKPRTKSQGSAKTCTIC